MSDINIISMPDGARIYPITIHTPEGSYGLVDTKNVPACNGCAFCDLCFGIDETHLLCKFFGVLKYNVHFVKI